MIWKTWQFLVSGSQDQAYKSSPRWSETFPRDALVGDIRHSKSAPLRFYLKYIHYLQVSHEIFILESLLAAECSIESMPNNAKSIFLFFK